MEVGLVWFFEGGGGGARGRADLGAWYGLHRTRRSLFIVLWLAREVYTQVPPSYIYTHKINSLML